MTTDQITITFTDTIPSKKNSKSIFRNSKTGRPFITSSDKFKIWHKEQQIRQRKYSNLGILKCKINYIFYSKDNRKYDMSNKIESIQDFLVDMNIITGDGYGVIQEFSAKYCGISKEKYCEVIITIL